MPNLTASESLSGIGGLISSAATRSDELGGNLECLGLPPAETGILTTRTDPVSGEITMDDAGHSIQTGDQVDIFWSGGGVGYHATVGTVAGTLVPFSGISGNLLPAQDSPVWVGKVVNATVFMKGPQLQLLSALMAHAAPDGSTSFVAWSDGSMSQHTRKLISGVAYKLDLAGGDEAMPPIGSNPITVAKLSNGSTTQAGNYSQLWLEHATP